MTPKRLKIKFLSGGHKFGLARDSSKVLGAQRRVRLQVLSPPCHRHGFSAIAMAFPLALSALGVDKHPRVLPRAQPLLQGLAASPPKALVAGAGRGCCLRAIPAVNLQERWGGKGGARSKGQRFAMPQRCCVPAQTDLPVTRLHFISLVLELPVIRLRSSHSFRFGGSPLVFCPLGLQLGPRPCQVSSMGQSPAEAGILNFDGTSLGVRTLLLMPDLMPFCGLAILGCEVPEKPINSPYLGLGLTFSL